MDRNVTNTKGTFVVKVEYSQKKSWQGYVTWAEQNRSVRFRSVLELLKLIDEAMTQGAAFGSDKKHEAS